MLMSTLTFEFDPCIPKLIGFLLSHVSLSTTCIWIFIMIGKNCSLYRAHKVISTECKVNLDLWFCNPKSKEFLLSLSTTYMWSSKVIVLNLECLSIVPTVVTRVDLDLWSCDPKSLELLFSSSTTWMRSLKVIQYWSKPVAFIVCRSWPLTPQQTRDPKGDNRAPECLF